MRHSTGGTTLRAIAYQAVAIATAILLGWFLIRNTIANLDARHIASGFGFLAREAGFERHALERRSPHRAPGTNW